MRFLTSLLILVCSLSIEAVAQQQNTLPSSGRVGVGTTQPNKSLEVVGQSSFKGKVEVDSSVTVRDTMWVDKGLTVQDYLIVEGDVKIQESLSVSGPVYLDGVLSTNQVGQGSEVIMKVGSTVQTIPIDDLLVGLDTMTPLPNCTPGVPQTEPSKWKGLPGILHTVCPDTKVGIGTGWPEQSLDVVGSAIVRDSVFVNTTDHNAVSNFNGSEWHNGPIAVGTTPQVDRRLAISSFGSNNAVYITHTGGSGKALLVETPHWVDAISVNESTNGANTFRVTGEGRVVANDLRLINTAGTAITAADSTGEVNFKVTEQGKVYATEVIVRMPPFPDYVFEEDYVLMPLSEVEAYIKQHGHLPGIPAAQQVEEEGIGLAEMNRLLLEKLEEMTLHSIDMEKRIKELESKLNVEGE